MIFVVVIVVYVGDFCMVIIMSIENFGLLKVLLLKFEVVIGIYVQVIVVGIGKVVKLGELGDVDVVLVYVCLLEDVFVVLGGGIDCCDVMYNDFFFVGFEIDLVYVCGQKNVIQGMEIIVVVGEKVGVKFILCGDNFGIDVMEKVYWKIVNIDLKGKLWYVSVGLGMGEVLNMVVQMNVYMFLDCVIYGVYCVKMGFDIVLVGDLCMFNFYGIIVVNLKKYFSVNYIDVIKLIEWIMLLVGQQVIVGFKVNGEQVFFFDYGKFVISGK